MVSRVLTAISLAAAVLVASQASAQTPAPPTPFDAIPEKMPFSEPYGPPISAQKAQAAIAAAMAEATKRGWAMDIAVYDSGANLVAFVRMDGALLGSIAVAEHKARAAVKYRRPTKAIETAVQYQDNKVLPTIDDMIASRGGIPLIEDGKIIGAIGCSSGTGSQDEVVCMAGAATINK